MQDLIGLLRGVRFCTTLRSRLDLKFWQKYSLFLILVGGTEEPGSPAPSERRNVIFCSKDDYRRKEEKRTTILFPFQPDDWRKWLLTDMNFKLLSPNLLHRRRHHITYRIWLAQRSSIVNLHL